MFAEFFLRAVAAGLAVALVTGPLGCFVVWRRMAYFGETIAHASLLGVGLSLVTGFDLSLSVFFTALAFAGALTLLERAGLPTDSLLGILSYSALSLGVVIAASLPGIRLDFTSLLFGDILAVTWRDVAVIVAGGGLVLAVLSVFWRDLLASTVSADIAAAEGLRPDLLRLVLVLLIAAVVSVAIKIIGILLITAMLVMPAATARRLATTPEGMAAAAAAVGSAAVLLGLGASLRFDTPPGPAIVSAALALFLVTLALPRFAARSGGRDGDHGPA